MASKRDPFIVKSFRYRGPYSSKLDRYVRDGWEVVSQTPHGMSGVVNAVLRKPNPKYRRK